MIILPFKASGTISSLRACLWFQDTKRATNETKTACDQSQDTVVAVSNELCAFYRFGNGWDNHNLSLGVKKSPLVPVGFLEIQASLSRGINIAIMEVCKVDQSGSLQYAN